MKAMRTFPVILFLGLLVSACQNEEVRPLMRIETGIGEPFIVSAPAEVTFKESGLTLYFDSFSHYVDFSVAPARTMALIQYGDRKISLHHNLQCDQHDCDGYTYDENAFREVAILDESYSLTFDKVIASSVVKQYEPKGKEFRVDSAQFIVRVNN